MKRPGRGKIWEVLIDEKSMARFSNLEDAVAAVDYELERRGRLTALSALPTALWRRGESGSMPAKALQRALWDRIVGRSDTRGIRAQ